jgi:hypothetical protein
MASRDEIDFDLSTRDAGSQDRVNDIMDELGIANWGEIIVNWEDADAGDLRSTRYNSPEEALFDMYDRGLIGFTDIVYYPDEDMYSIVVDYEE